MMQRDDISYKTLMDIIGDKKNMLISWKKKEPDGTCARGPSLSEYLNSTNNGNSFGAFKVSFSTPRDDLAAECSLHIDRLLEEIECRYPASELHQCLAVRSDHFSRKQLSLKASPTLKLVFAVRFSVFFEIAIDIANILEEKALYEG